MIIDPIWRRLLELHRLRESIIDVEVNSNHYTIEYDVLKRNRDIVVDIEPISGITYFALGDKIGSELSKEFYGVRRIPNNHHNPGRWLFSYTYTRRRK